MTLTAIHLARFKAFEESQRIPIRPITLIFGANSAGKSSIIHALALANHALETGDLDVQRTRIGGESIDLGGFRQYIHRHERNRRFDLTLELDAARLDGPADPLLRSVRTLSLEISIGAGITAEQRNLFGDQEREVGRDFAVRVEAFSLLADGEVLVSLSARRDGLLRLDRLEHEHPVLREIVTGLLAFSTTTTEVHAEDFAAVADALDELVPGISASVTGLFPRLAEPAAGGQTDESAEFLTVSRGRRGEDLARAARAFFPRRLRQLVNGLADAADAEIRKLQYLGPLRSYPPRHLAFSQHQDTNWFAGGGYAWDVVRTREDVRARVNAWLGDATRMKSPYELVVRDLVPAGSIPSAIVPRLNAALHDQVRALITEMESGQRSELLEAAIDAIRESIELGIEDEEVTLGAVDDFVGASTDADLISVQWQREIVETRTEVLQDLVLVDKRSGTPVSHRDVGIGVSQVLPVLVSAYASTGKLIAIEQPEIHLHPALQAELGDVFLESALGESQNTFLLETHSEHLILRIMRRIRETADGELPEGATAVRPHQVSVLYVQPGRGGSEVLHIPLTSDGDFERPWPEGFFAERAKELF